MKTTEFHLAIPSDVRAYLARGWLLLGLFSLLVAGLFALLLVLARTPYFQSIIPWADFFYTALIVHVDLSVLVWFLAVGGVLWSLNSNARFVVIGKAALALAALGAAAMALAAFTGEANPVTNNYIPVLQQRFFLIGLALFAVGIALLVLRTLASLPKPGPNTEGASALCLGLLLAAATVAIALISIVWSYRAVPATIHDRAYFELLFWGGGHLLQFAYTLLMLVAWLWLASASGVTSGISARIAMALLLLGFAPVLVAPIGYLAHDVVSAGHILFFTAHMKYAGGLAAVPIALILLYQLFRAAPASGAQPPLRAALAASVLLFSVGGVIGFLIQGTNVTIPAHYHGSIVGVTLAFMGLTYHLLPKLGYRQPDRRWAFIQPWVLGGGQLLHITGLAWSGGYGVQRKVAGAAQGLESSERMIAMGLMGLGGLIAIIGGLIFLVVVYRAMRRRR